VAVPPPLTFGGTTVTFDGDYAITALPGGHRIVAAPQDDAAYRATALRLGYASDTLRMMREHEAAHSAVCHWLGLPESPTLRAVADDEGPTDLSNLEEDVVLALAKFANAAGVRLIDVFARMSAKEDAP
jgi:hypothetical protein